MSFVKCLTLLVLSVVLLNACTGGISTSDKKPPAMSVTGKRLDALTNNYGQCLQFLTSQGIQFTPVPDKPSGECPLKNQITLDKGLYPYSKTASGTCGLIAATIVWEKTVVQKNALKIFGQDVAKITHYGMYSCRYINGNRARPSEHGKGNAIDVAGFTLADGTYISIKNDWNAGGKKEKFLKTVFQQSCSIFKGNLGPNYNRAHADHFHFDMGTWRSCD